MNDWGGVRFIRLGPRRAKVTGPLCCDALTPESPVLGGRGRRGAVSSRETELPGLCRDSQITKTKNTRTE